MTEMKVYILLLMFGAILAAPQPERIMGGGMTLIQYFPFFVGVQHGIFGAWSQHCGGSLLSDHVVLTAASCLERHLAITLRVRVGASTNFGGDPMDVSDFKMHSSWNSPIYENDIGLIFLRRRAVQSSYVGFASIAGASYTVPDNAVVVSIGLGVIRPDGSTPDFLQRTNLNIVNQDTCRQRYAHLKTQPGYEDTPIITENVMCTGFLTNDGRGFCSGDFGGPIIVEDEFENKTVVGVASWTHRCGDAVYPGVSTRVSRYSQWIVENSRV
ncbi:hypothetical protein JYU34_013748 [Plutella xylostella]|uniref:Peptidase S1 domain-containing protein n=1 Tax=Plutella xylostella TaxID=51655 RepID=A0ABQ7QB05_PLUXY|nr:hypothetical protein JYU34_013748 [Plutella xylostella]